jgi:hypothetical protein
LRLIAPRKGGGVAALAIRGATAYAFIGGAAAYTKDLITSADGFRA